MADFLQQEHSALTRTVELKLQVMILIKCFRVESATVALDTVRNNVHSCVELAMVVLTLSGVRMILYHTTELARPCMECRRPSVGVCYLLPLLRGYITVLC